MLLDPLLDPLPPELPPEPLLPEPLPLLPPELPEAPLLEPELLEPPLEDDDPLPPASVVEPPPLELEQLAARAGAQMRTAIPQRTCFMEHPTKWDGISTRSVNPPGTAP